jgi:hypothetical protein
MDSVSQDFQNEKWVPIYGFESYYMVSNMGRVKSLDRTHSRGWAKSVNKPGKILKPCNNGNGYLYITLMVNASRKTHSYIHKLVATHFLHNYNKHPEVNHKDGDKSNNNVANLEWISILENRRHASKMGLNQKRGKKINAVKVVNISTGELFGCIRDVADRFSLNYGTLKDGLRHNRVYKGFQKVQSIKTAI